MRKSCSLVLMSKSSDERDHKFYTACKSMGCQVNFLFPTWKGYLGAYSDQRVTVSDIWNTLKKWVFWLKEAEREWKSDTRPLSWKRGWKPSKRREFWRQRICGIFFRFRDIAIWKCIVGRFKSTIVTYCLCWMLDLRHVSVGQTSLYWHSDMELI